MTSSRDSHASCGFALVITVSLMVLLTVIAVGLLSLGVITLRATERANATSIARGNARLALMLALGELQKQAGPDQRITATTAMTGRADLANPGWTQVFASDDPQAAPVLLVSGENPDAAVALNDGNSVTLATPNDSSGTRPALRAPKVMLDLPASCGGYAWWVGDEGVKARIDIARPTPAATDDKSRLVRALSPMEPGLVPLGDAWTAFKPGGAARKNDLVSMNTLALVSINNLGLPGRYFDDLTTGGYGLPVDVVHGGMKVDLSLVFDRSQTGKSFARNYFGAIPGAETTGMDAIRYHFEVTDPAKFYLSKTLQDTSPTGPNWGILWNYARLWENVSGQQSPPIPASPYVDSDARFFNWAPYQNINNGAYRNDAQHTNNSLGPVVSTIQMGFRLKSVLFNDSAKPSPPNPKQYKLQLEFKPVFGIWNPHNITLKNASYDILWALYPFIQISSGTPGAGGTTTTNLWMRQYWGMGSNVIPTPENPVQGTWFETRTEEVDLQPGEFRLFSIATRVKLTSRNLLTSSWNEQGAFYFDVPTLQIPEGQSVWVDRFNLQDSQVPETAARYPTLDKENVSATWYMLRGQAGTFNRSSNLWISGNQEPFVPEPIVPGSKTTCPVENLTGSNIAHIGTWSLFSRTSTQVTEAGQSLRGCIDCNPRAMVSNPRWDGSAAASPARSGWNFTSHLIGGSHADAPRGQIGDGYGGNRGLIAEGGAGEPEPQAVMPRYRGFGGPSNTATGFNNVILYDVPRGPLVSIGQFQHANLSRYNFEPGFIVGNSYANPRIPLHATSCANFAGMPGFTLVDLSKEVNERLWDTYFFSTLGLDYTNDSGPSFDKVFDPVKLTTGETSLPNPRMRFQPLAGDTSIDAIIRKAGEQAPLAIASRIQVHGAFNVNSTSKNAWKAVLASMTAAELPVLDLATGACSWADPQGIRFNRFSNVLSSLPYQKTGGGDDEAAYWLGWRKLSDQELEALATEIVKEVKARGPFRSLAEFVNRNPAGSTPDHQRKGALQAALDRTVNAGLPRSLGDPATNPNGAAFSNAITGENQSAGFAAYLLQGDVLQSLAPILQVRSDTFRIRAYGEATDHTGHVTARAWCEAGVQRIAEYPDPADPPHTARAGLTRRSNISFGRRLQIVSFRWLDSKEI